MSDTHGPPSRYVLPDAENARIFNDIIVPAELSHLIPAPCSSSPTTTRRRIAILLVGQTGAGKTRTSPPLLAALASHHHRPPHPPPTHLIADAYKAYHPSYADLSLHAPHLASAATGPDARRWLSLACSSVAAKPSASSVLVESACRHPADFADLVRILASPSTSQKTVTVRVAVLAVPAPLSRLGVLLRYHARLPESCSGRLPPRLTPRMVHDVTYAGLLEAAAWLDAETPAEEVVVLRRGERVAYRWRRDGDGGAGEEEGSKVREAVVRERRRPLSEEETRRAKHDITTLRRLADGLSEEEREGLEKELDEIEELLRDMNEARLGDDELKGFPELRPFDHEAFVKVDG